jgi:hypothetical protein
VATGFTKNFVVKNGITTGNITLDAGTGNITGTNLSVTGITDLGNIGNVKITGGTSGQAIITDGAGNLSFANASAASSPAPMPTYVAVGDDLIISANYQGLFGYPITIDGTMTVDGILIDVNDNGNGGGGGGTATALNANIANVSISGGSSGYYLQTNGSGTLTWAAGGGGGNGSPGGSTTQVQFNDAGSFAGNTGFTFNKTTGIFTSPYLTGNGNGLANIQGANVSGEVTWAAASNAVAVGNVIGLGNIATINKDGNGSNVFYGNGFFASASLIYSDSNTTTLLSSFGSNTITTTGNVSVGNISATNLGNLSSLNKDGNASNILYGNGVFSAVPTTYDNSNVATLLSSFGSNTITTTGNVSVGNIIGNGQALTGITGANVSGAVSYAATANSVAGANVTGEVSYAATANSITGANVSGAVSYAATANSVAGANVTGEVSYAATANSVAAANITGTVSTATTAGTVTTSDQPNITSVGTLTLLSISGNANIGNIGTSGLVTATGNINGGNLVTGGTLSATGGATFEGNVAMTNKNITGLAEPIDPYDAATKQYVDSIAQGLHTHDACQAATPTTLATITSGTITYDNGTSGVGATLTTTGSFNLIDGVNVQTSGTRILVKNEANTAHNGIYVWSNATVITRADDFDTPVEMAGGDFTFVQAGTTYDNTGWVMPDPVPTVGTSPVVWIQFSGAGTYTAGTGLTLTGSVFSVNESQTQITSVGTLTSLSISGNATVGNIQASAGVFTTVTGSLTTASQPNITSIGTLTSLSISGNASVGNLNTAGSVVGSTLTSNIATGTAPLTVTSTTRVANLNVAYANVADLINVTAPGSGTGYLIFANATTGNITEYTSSGISSNLANNSITATTFVGALSGAASTASTVTTAAQPNITSIGTLTTLSVSGNANIGNIGTSGLITATGNLNAGNIITAGIVSATGNVTGGNFIGNGSQLTGVATSARAIGYSLVFGG